MKFEEKMNQLEEIITELESNNCDLEQSIDKYTKAMNLVKECNEQLQTIEKNIQQIVTENGLENFQVEE